MLGSLVEVVGRSGNQAYRFIKSLAIGYPVLVRARVTVVVGPFSTGGDGVGVRERDDEECSWDL
jgi:hypothetical protein